MPIVTEVASPPRPAALKVPPVAVMTPTGPGSSEGSTSASTRVGTLSDGAESVVSRATQAARNNAIVVTRPEGLMKQGKKGDALDVLTNYFYMNKRSNFKLIQYRVDFSPKEDHTYLKKQLVASHTAKLGAHIFDGHMLYKTQEIPEQVIITSIVI
jgi:hypothetical protein